MKKKNFVIPLVCLILSLTGILSMTFLRTGFLYQLCSLNGSDPSNLIKYSGIWFKYNPNVNSLSAVVRANNPMYIFYNTLEDRQVYTKEYFKKSASFSEQFLDLYKTEKPYENNITYVIQGSEEISYMQCYIFSLYLAGENDKAISNFENYFDNIEDENLYIILSHCKSFISYVYNNSQNEQDKERLTEILNKYCERINNYNPKDSVRFVFENLTAPNELMYTITE